MDKCMMDRMESLERENKWFKGIGILVILLISSFVFMGQSSPIAREVRAQKFSLYDANGKHRGMMFTSEGQAILVLTDGNREPRITLTVGTDGTAAIGLADKGDKVRVLLSVSQGNPRLAFYSKEDRERLLLHIGTDGQPRIGLMDVNKSPRIVLGGAGEDWGVAVYDRKGNPIGAIGEKK